MTTPEENSLSMSQLTDTLLLTFAEGEALSAMMKRLLERQYLDQFDSDLWQMIPSQPMGAIPLLRQVRSAGRHKEPEEASRAMAQALMACHQPGHSLMTVLFGQHGQQQLLWGTKRIASLATGSTAAFAASLSGHLQAIDRELDLSEAVRLNDDTLQPLQRFLREAPACVAITGIPSARQGHWHLHQRGLDRLAQAIGSGTATVVVVAEPLPGQAIDALIERCLRLKSELHAFVQTTVQNSHSKGQNKSLTEQRKQGTTSYGSSGLLMEATFFINLLNQISPTTRVIGSLAGLAIGGANLVAQSQLSRQSAVVQEAQLTFSEGQSSGESRTFVNAQAEMCVELLDEYLKRFRTTRNYGGWMTVTYLLADSEARLAALSGTLRSLAAGDQTHLDPLRELRLPGDIIREAIQTGTILTATPTTLADKQPTHPLGTLYDRLGTCLNSEELALLMPLPFQPLPGVPTRLPIRFSLTAPLITRQNLMMGQLHDGLTVPLGPLAIPLDSLGTHAFIAGKSGSGKTNTCMQLLSEAYGQHGIPFMVIEPAKAEYRNLMQLPSLEGHLRVFAVGNPNAPALRLNPFEPVSGITISRHIDLLKSVFNASFPMFAGMAYVLEEAMYELYQERGWQMANTTNRYLSDRSTPAERAVLMPTLPDLLQKIEVVLSRKNYGKEIHQNMGAALRSRIQSLLVGTKGTVFDTRSSIPMEELMDRPCIIELQHVGSDEEKAFLSALLYIFVYEYAEQRQRRQPLHQREQVQHLLLIEEAHQLLGARTQAASEEVGDPKGKAVALFTDMLAELRSYGEGILVSDQTPTKLTRDVIRNTNLKLIHRLTDPDERLAAGRSMNLSDEQISALAVLPDGFAVVHDKYISEPVLMKVAPFKRQHLVILNEVEEAAYLQASVLADKQYLFKNGGCLHCLSPCLHYLSVAEERSITHQSPLEFLFISLVQGHEHDVVYLNQWLPWLEKQRLPRPYEEPYTDDYLYCLILQQADTWLGEKMLQKQINQNTSPKGTTPQFAELRVPIRLAKDQFLQAIGGIVQAWLFGESDNVRRQRYTESLATMPVW